MKTERGRRRPQSAPDAQTEVELKFQVPPGRRARVAAEVTGPGDAARRVRLQAAYFDTADHALAAAGMALRVRREGRQWVQTLKGAGDDGWTRDEHECALAPGEVDPAAPRADPRRHAGTAIGERLLALLDVRAIGLVCHYHTDIRRTLRLLRSRHGTVELAYDEGRLIAGTRVMPVAELEVELKAGHPLAVIEVARRWVGRHGLWLDTRSKAERGSLLARGVDIAPPVGGGVARLRADHTPRQALQAMVAACRDAIIVNASQVADGHFEPEHLHQLRVGLRRLRSGLRLVDGDPDAAALAGPLMAPAAAVFRQLGSARDATVLDGELGPALDEALREAGLPGGLPVLAPPPGAGAPVAAVRDAATQGLWLDLLATGLPPRPVAVADVPGALDLPAASSRRRRPPSLHRLLADRLAAWHRAVRADARRFDRLDEEARHQLRKRVKRLRYAAEFAAPLFDPADLARMLKPLRRLQAHLGQLNDVHMALQTLQAAPGEDVGTGVAIGWLLARREALVAAARPLARAVARSRPGWTRR